MLYNVYLLEQCDRDVSSDVLNKLACDDERMAFGHIKDLALEYAFNEEQDYVVEMQGERAKDGSITADLYLNDKIMSKFVAIPVYKQSHLW